MPKVAAFLGIARGPFLILDFTLIASAAAAAAYDGRVFLVPTLLALVGLVALHAAVNSLNEASDMRTGIDLRTERTPFSGGSGTLPSGALDWRTARWFGLGASAVGAVIGLWFLARVGSILLPILILGALCVLAYTEGLARTGLGEIAAGLGLGALPVIGGVIVQEGRLGPAALAAAIPAFFMTFNLLLLNEFPDEQADRPGGRRNLVLLLGRPAAARVYAAAALATPLSIVVAVVAGALPPSALIGTLPSLLLVKPLAWGLRRASDPVPVPALGANVAWNLGTNTLLALGVAAAVWLR
jgi:1,4-dihydroxy-2-naphthoate polyprenyltransferase